MRGSYVGCTYAATECNGPGWTPHDGWSPQLAPGSPPDTHTDTRALWYYVLFAKSNPPGAKFSQIFLWQPPQISFLVVQLSALRASCPQRYHPAKHQPCDRTPKSASTYMPSLKPMQRPGMTTTKVWFLNLRLARGGLTLISGSRTMKCRRLPRTRRTGTTTIR